MKKNCWWWILCWLFCLNAEAQEECKKIIITGPPNSAPTSWAKDGKLTGAGVEFLTRLAKYTRVPNVEFRLYPSWPDALAAVQKGEVDAIFSTGKSVERVRYLDYVYPAMDGQFAQVLVRKGQAFRLLSPTSLDGRKGLAIKGETFGDGPFGQYIAKSTEISITPDAATSIKQLLAGTADYALLFENVSYVSFFTMNLQYTLDVLTTYPYRARTYLAFSKRSICSAELRNEFSRNLKLAQAVGDLSDSFPSLNELKVKYRDIFETLPPP